MTKTEILKAIYAGINGNNVPAILEYCATDIVRIEPTGFPSAGTYRGHAELAAHVVKGRETWAEGACEPESFQVAGEKVIAFLHVKVRLKNHQDWIDARIADVFTFRDQKVIEMRTFEKSEEALKWVQENP